MLVESKARRRFKTAAVQCLKNKVSSKKSSIEAFSCTNCAGCTLSDVTKTYCAVFLFIL